MLPGVSREDARLHARGPLRVRGRLPGDRARMVDLVSTSQGRETLSAAPGAEAERLAGRTLEREMRAGVPHFKPGQHHATIEAIEAQDFFNHDEIGDVGRVTYVDQMGHLCVVLTWRDRGSNEWRATWVSRTGMMTTEPPRKAPEGFVLSDKMLAALAAAEAQS